MYLWKNQTIKNLTLERILTRLNSEMIVIVAIQKNLVLIESNNDFTFKTFFQRQLYRTIDSEFRQF